MESQRTNSGASQPPSTIQIPVCEICGQDFDVSKNLVVTTCKPCRRFLRKFEKTQLGDSCPFDGECEVTLENRSECGPCRYNKYLKIRMERDNTTTPSAVNRAVTFSSLNRFHQQQMPPAVDQVQENEESCKLCEQAPQGRKFKVMSGLLMCGRCRVLVAHNVKNQKDDPSNVCLRDDGVCSDYPSLTSCSVCLFEKYKDLVTKAPKTKKSRAVSFRIATCPQNYTDTVHQGFVPTTSGVNQAPLSIPDQQVQSEYAIPPPIDSTISASSMSPAPTLQNSMASEQCKICGDTVTILGNFGVVACGACVDFYSRKLKSRHHQECKNAKRCKITVKNRNSCPTCRFEKCRSLGMVDKNLVKKPAERNQNNECASDSPQELENQPPTSSSDQWNGTLVSDPISVPQRKRPANDMLQDYGNQSVPNEPMEMCKLCKRVPEQYPHQVFQGIRMCQGCTDLIKFRNPVQMKCQKGNGECRIYCWVVDCSSCILKEYDDLMEMHAVRTHESNLKVPNTTDRGSHMKKSRKQAPLPCHQNQEEDNLDDRQLFDDNGMGGYRNEGYPGSYDNLNLGNQNQNVDYRSPQIQEVDHGTSHDNYNDPNRVDTDIGQEDTFTVSDKSIFGDQEDQQTPLDPQLFDYHNGHYSEHTGFPQDQGYSDNINLDNQHHSHNDDQSWNLQLEGLISPSKTYLSTSENMEYQNQYQDDEFLIPQVQKVAPEMHSYHSGNPDLSKIDNMSDRGNNILGSHPEQGYPGTSDNINLERQNRIQKHKSSMEYQNQHQDDDYSNLQIGMSAPGMSHYHSGNPDIIEIDNGQNVITEKDSSAVDTFTMGGRGNNSLGYKKPKMQLPCQPYQDDQNGSHTLQLFDDSNGHYSEQSELHHKQEYSGVPDNKTLSHQNHNQEHHSSMEENSDSEITVIGEKVNTEVNSSDVGRFPMNGKGYSKRSRMHPPPDATLFAQRNLNTNLKQNSRMDLTDRRMLVRPSGKPVLLSNSNPQKTSTAPQALARISVRASAVAARPATVHQHQNNKYRQRPNVQYKPYQNMTNQPSTSVLVDRSRGVEQYVKTRNDMTALKESVIEYRDMINQPSTSQSRPQTDRMHQYRSRNHRHNGPFAQDFSENVAQNGVPIEPNVSDLYDSRDLHHYPQQVQDHTESHQTPLSLPTSSNPYPQLGNHLPNSDQDRQPNNTQTFEVEPEIFQYQPKNLAPEAEKIHVDKAMMHDNPDEHNTSPQAVNDDDEENEFRIGTHEDDFDPDEFEDLLNDIPDEFN